VSRGREQDSTRVWVSRCDRRGPGFRDAEFTYDNNRGKLFAGLFLRIKGDAMKNYLLIGAFWVFGLILGSVWHQSELALAKTEIARLNRELATKTRRNLIPDMARMMAMPDTRPQNPPAPPALETSSPSPPREKTDTTGVALTGTPYNELDQEEFAQMLSEMLEDTESMDEAYTILADLWRTRRELALAALIDNLGLTPGEIANFENALADMNDALADTMNDVFDRYDFDGAEPSPEDAFRMVNDFSGVFVDTYDSMDTILPGRWRDHTGKPLDLTAFVDPSIFKPIMDPDRNWNFK
jgi:hypothetical protein